MANYTSNLNLYKIDPVADGNSTFNIETMLNENWDKIDEKFDEQEKVVDENRSKVSGIIGDIGVKEDLTTNEKGSLVGAVNEVGAQLADIAHVIVASGTGTAITLSMPSVTAYTANMKLTFIASADNSDGATTVDINSLGAKNLYKPNTTTAPNLKSGKPYTVWYDGTNFFLQASAEGNALAEHVLAGKIFSNDDVVGLIGTLTPMKMAIGTARAYYNQGGTWSTDIGGLSFTPAIVIIGNISYTGVAVENAKDIYDVSGLSNSFISHYAGSANKHVVVQSMNPDGFRYYTFLSSGNSSHYADISWIAIR